MATTSLRPPAVLLDAARERLTELQEQEADLGANIRSYYRELFEEFRQELEAWFAVHFAAFRDPTTQETVWDPVKAHGLRAVERWTDRLRAFIEAVAPEVEGMLDDELTDAYEESHDHALWMLALGGIDVGRPTGPGSRKTILAALLAAGVAGLNYRDRFRIWNNEILSRWARLFKASVVSGRSGPETMEALGRLANTFAGRVTALAQNELHRAGTLGARAAITPFRRQLEGEVWLTREDSLVCPLCRGKHLTITTDQPITHSHPGCRCKKVPIPLNFRGQPVDYVTFLRGIGRR